MDSNFLDQFPLPEVASQDLKRQQRFANSIDDGVIDFAGHDQGVPYRFFKHLEWNKTQSDLLGYEKYDELECIEWLIDRKNKPTEQIRFLPVELLKFDRDGEVVGGKYFESYKRFKAGLAAPGLSISKWGILGDAEVASLAHDGIFSVEQFAALPRSKVEGKYPQDIIDAFERAILYVNGQAHREEQQNIAGQFAELQAAHQKLVDELNELKKGKGKKKNEEV